MRVLAATAVLMLWVPMLPPHRPHAARVARLRSAESQTGGIAGRWRGGGGGLSLALHLTQSGDSVGGEGTYAAMRGSVGCGGETLPDSGRVVVAGRLSQAELRAHLRFTGGWGPPFVATLVGTDTLRGRFVSVDRPGCAVLLVRAK